MRGLNRIETFLTIFLLFSSILLMMNLTSVNAYDITFADYSVVKNSADRFIMDGNRITSITYYYAEGSDYVYKNHGSNFFYKSYNFSWNSEITSYNDVPSLGGLLLISNNTGDLKAIQTGGYNYYGVWFNRSAVLPYDLYVTLGSNAGGTLSYLVSVSTDYYFIFNKNESIGSNLCDISLKIYSDSSFTTLLKWLNITSNDFYFQYFQPSYNYDAGAGGADRRMNYYSENYIFRSSFLLVTTEEATGIETTNATLNGHIIGFNDTDATARFQYGTTIGYGTNTSNQTLTASDTNFSANITSLYPGSVYHYRVYVNNTKSESRISDNKFFLTKPNATSGAVFTYINSSYINISWNKNGCNRTVVVFKSTGAPTSLTDGTVIYNGTNNYYNFNTAGYLLFYFSFYSYSNWSVNNTELFQYGSPYIASEGTYGLLINCYEESTGKNLTFNVSISNIDGSQVYNAYNCVNTKAINSTLCPQGDVIVFISSPNHKNRSYSMTITASQLYILNTYLLNETTFSTQLCRIDVVGPQTEYGADPPVENAFIEIRAYDNNTGVYQTVTSSYTDANGQIFVYLAVNNFYFINITKTDYGTEISSFIVQPDVVVYTFRLTPSTTIVIPSYDLFSVNISFVCAMLDGGGYNQMGNITIAYSDVNLSTINTDIYLYSYYNDTLTFINTWHNTTNTVSLTVGNINTTRTHIAKLYYNNTASFSDMSPPFIVYINPVNLWSERARFDINERITNIIGPMVINGNVIPWPDVLAVIPAILVLVLLGPFNTGVAIIGCGLTIGLSNALFATWFTNAFPTLLVTACPTIIVIGVLWIMSKPGSDQL